MRCIKCGGDMDSVCQGCGHTADRGDLVREEVRGDDRGWMVTESTVDAHNYKAQKMLESMSAVLHLPQSDLMAEQAHGIMTEYEHHCRARRAAYCLRRRLSAAGLAIALKALERLSTEPHADCQPEEVTALAELRERVRHRLKREGGSESDAVKWRPDRCLSPQTLPTLQSFRADMQSAQRSVGIAERNLEGAATRPECETLAPGESSVMVHPCAVPGGFAALRMTFEQVRDDLLLTSHDNPACERAISAIQEELWQEPAICLGTQQQALHPVGWPDFDSECSKVNYPAVRAVDRVKVFAILLKLAQGESICRSSKIKLGFSWESQPNVAECVAATALWIVCRRAKHSVLLSDVAKAMQMRDRGNRKAGTLEGDLRAQAEDMRAVGMDVDLESVPLNMPHLLYRTIATLLQALKLLDGALLQSVVNVANALFEEMQVSGRTQGRQPGSTSVAVAVLAVHMVLLPRNKPEDPTLEMISSQAQQSQTMSKRTLTESINRMKPVVMHAAARARLPFAVTQRNIWLHGKDILLLLHPLAGDPSATPGKDSSRAGAAGSAVSLAAASLPVHPLRKREHDSLTSAKRVLQWARDVANRHMDASAAASDREPEALQMCDQAARTELLKMLNAGISLADIKPGTLLQRLQSGGEGRQDGNSGDSGLNEVLSERELEAGGPYLYSQAEVLQRTQHFQHLEESSAEDTGTGCGTGRKRKMSSGRFGGTGIKVPALGREEKSTKVDYARLEQMIQEDEI